VSIMTTIWMNALLRDARPAPQAIDVDANSEHHRDVQAGSSTNQPPTHEVAAGPTCPPYACSSHLTRSIELGPDPGERSERSITQRKHHRR
jgi:hypothetical protein